MIVFIIFLLKPDCTHVKLSLMYVKMGKIAMISENYHNIGRLLLFKIIVDSKNWIIVKENIMVNRQN